MLAAEPGGEPADSAGSPSCTGRHGDCRGSEIRCKKTGEAIMAVTQ